MQNKFFFNFFYYYFFNLIFVDAECATFLSFCWRRKNKKLEKIIKINSHIFSLLFIDAECASNLLDIFTLIFVLLSSVWMCEILNLENTILVTLYSIIPCDIRRCDIFPLLFVNAKCATIFLFFLLTQLICQRVTYSTDVWEAVSWICTHSEISLWFLPN